MARGLRRGPVLLRFRSLVDSVAHYVAGIVDTRQLSKIRYTLRDCYLSADLALFFVPDAGLCCTSSVAFSANSKPTTSPPPSASSARSPCDSQLRDLIDRHDHTAHHALLRRLDRSPAALQMAPALDLRRHLITLDGSALRGGSRYFSSESVHCAHCLTTTKNGTTRYHHDILQAAIVHPDKRQVLPLAPEFVRNSDADGGNYRKQDCEITAGYRMLCSVGSAPTIPVWPQLSSPTAFTPSNRASSR